MELDKIINIRNYDLEKEIIIAIKDVKLYLNGLVNERTCKIYSSYIYRELRKKHISVRMINTLDLGLDYEHIFLLTLKDSNEYILIDLTFPQFKDISNIFLELKEKGYQLINDAIFNYYISIISKNINRHYSIQDVYINNIDSFKKL